MQQRTLKRNYTIDELYMKLYPNSGCHTFLERDIEERRKGEILWQSKEMIANQKPTGKQENS